MPRALLSVSDKTGIVDFAKELSSLGWELISTGGTAKTLREAGLPVTDVSEITGVPEMLDGRVKTLHPAVHGGLLAKRNDPEHMAALEEHKILPIDLIAVNLYPFRETASRRNVTADQVIEQIDIGGPSMLRSAAKNFESVWVVVDPQAKDHLWSALSSLAFGDAVVCGLFGFGVVEQRRAGGSTRVTAPSSDSSYSCREQWRSRLVGW